MVVALTGTGSVCAAPAAGAAVSASIVGPQALIVRQLVVPGVMGQVPPRLALGSSHGIPVAS
jgi:hypothetical protein